LRFGKLTAGTRDPTDLLPFFADKDQEGCAFWGVAALRIQPLLLCIGMALLVH
jgi:hypothetical protein